MSAKTVMVDVLSIVPTQTDPSSVRAVAVSPCSPTTDPAAGLEKGNLDSDCFPTVINKQY